jgi:hypothetical protein
MSDVWKSRSYTISLFLAAMVIRALLGITRPDLSLDGTVIIGATTVLLLAPILHRWIYDRTLLSSKRQQAGYAMVTSAVLVGFGYWILVG